MTEETLTYKDRTLNIDMDKECARCPEKGVTKSGLCLKCVADNLIKSYEGRTIGFNVIQQAQAEICAMLEEFAEDIDKAYIQADYELSVPFTVSFKPTRIAGEIELIVGTNFVKDRVKHKIKVVVDSKQRNLPGFER